MPELQLLTKTAPDSLAGLRHASFLLQHRLMMRGQDDLALAVNNQLACDADLRPRYNRTLPMAEECCDLLLLGPSIRAQILEALHPENDSPAQDPHRAAMVRRNVATWLERYKIGRANYDSDPEYWLEALRHLEVLGQGGDPRKSKVDKTDPLFRQLNRAFLYDRTWHGGPYWINLRNALRAGETEGLIYDTRAE